MTRTNREEYTIFFFFHQMQPLERSSSARPCRFDSCRPRNLAPRQPARRNLAPRQTRRNLAPTDQATRKNLARVARFACAFRPHRVILDDAMLMTRCGRKDPRGRNQQAAEFGTEVRGSTESGTTELGGPTESGTKVRGPTESGTKVEGPRNLAPRRVDEAPHGLQGRAVCRPPTLRHLR